MKIALTLAVALALTFAALQAYIRLAPTDVARWHTDPGLVGSDDAEELRPDGIRVARGFDAPPLEVLAQIERIARATQRTKKIAGSPEVGMITYQTRSALWGFPDFTTVAADPGQDGGTRLRIHARLRFGEGDLGVNQARVEDWLDRLQ
ncbi:MAG: DUF1499 domain-containing protein [Pseudomonadota bacterium]